MYCTDITESEALDGEVRARLKAQSEAYNWGDLEEYSKSRYMHQTAISSATRQYRNKLESNYQGSNTRNIGWT